MSGDMAITIILSIFGGGALVTFLQFLITRHDEKTGQAAKVLKQLATLEKDIKNDISNLKKEIDEDRATNARIRILQFSIREKE